MVELVITYANIIAKLRQRCARLVGQGKVVCSYCCRRIPSSVEGDILMLRQGEMQSPPGYVYYISWKIIRLISGPAQRERTVKCKKQVVGADFPEELETHLEGEAQRVLE